MSQSRLPNNYNLIVEIISRSVANDWHAAKREWKLARIYIVDPLERCVCGHPIRECFVITNHYNGEEAIVGSCCVKKFLNLDASRLFTSIKRIAEDIRRTPCRELIDYAHDQGWINEEQLRFLHGTRRRRKLLPRQQARRTTANRQILERSGWYEADA